MAFAVDKDGTIVSSVPESQILGQIPTARFGYVFITPEKLEEGRRWLAQNIRGISKRPSRRTNESGGVAGSDAQHPSNADIRWQLIVYAQQK